jgi:hypothetical protein
MVLLATAIKQFYFQHVCLNSSFSLISIHGPDDSEFDFRTAMNIWGKLRKRHTFVQCILVEKAKESTEKSKLLKKIVMKSLLLRKIKRLPGACNRSPGSKLLSITTQLHCGGHLGGRAQLSDTILENNHPMTIPSTFVSN